MQAYFARSQYRRQKKRGEVGHDTRARLASAVEDYYDTLWEYADRNQQIKQAWEDSGVDVIQQLSREEVPVTDKSPGRGSNSQAGREAKILHVDPRRLIALSKQLDFFANRLGFGKEVNNGRTFGRIGGDEMWDDNDEEEPESDKNEASGAKPETKS